MWKITKKDGSTVEIERDNRLVIYINELNNEADLGEILKIERCEDVKHLFEYTCCKQCSKSVAAVGTYTCNNKTVIENYMPAEDYFWCDGEMFIRREYEK